MLLLMSLFVEATDPGVFFYSYFFFRSVVLGTAVMSLSGETHSSVG